MSGYLHDFCMFLFYLLILTCLVCNFFSRYFTAVDFRVIIGNLLYTLHMLVHYAYKSKELIFNTGIHLNTHLFIQK